MTKRKLLRLSNNNDKLTIPARYRSEWRECGTPIGGIGKRDRELCAIQRIEDNRFVDVLMADMVAFHRRAKRQMIRFFANEFCFVLNRIAGKKEYRVVTINTTWSKGKR